MIAKPLPHSEESERAALACILLQPEKLTAALGGDLSAKDLYLERHRWIFEAYVTIQSRGGEINYRSVHDELRRRKRNDKVGGLAYLAGLDTDLPDLSAWETICRTLRDLRAQRLAIEAAMKLEKAAQGTQEIADVLESHVQAIRRIATGRAGGTVETVNLVDLLDAYEIGSKPDERSARTIKTRIPKIDSTFGGLKPGDLAVLCGITAHGKTAFALQIATRAVEDGKRVLFISLEMPAEQLRNRLIVQRSGNLHYGIVEEPHDYAEDYHQEIGRAQLELLKLPGHMEITRAGRCTPEAAMALAQAEAAKPEGLDLVVIDYLTRLKIDIPKGSTRAGAVGDVSADLKGLALTLDAPVLLLHQFNRGPSKDWRRPTLADLKESGDVENDADIVMSTYLVPADNGQGWKENPIRGDAEIIILKDRRGQTGIVAMHWDGPSMTFSERSNQEEMRF